MFQVVNKSSWTTLVHLVCLLLTMKVFSSIVQELSSLNLGRYILFEINRILQVESPICEIRVCLKKIETVLLKIPISNKQKFFPILPMNTCTFTNQASKQSFLCPRPLTYILVVVVLFRSSYRVEISGVTNIL